MHQWMLVLVAMAVLALVVISSLTLARVERLPSCSSSASGAKESQDIHTRSKSLVPSPAYSPFSSSGSSSSSSSSSALSARKSVRAAAPIPSCGPYEIAVVDASGSATCQASSSFKLIVSDANILASPGGGGSCDAEPGGNNLLSCSCFDGMQMLYDTDHGCVCAEPGSYLQTVSPDPDYGLTLALLNAKGQSRSYMSHADCSAH